ncbi:hypothetical protein [Lichenicoccus sp.]|uniref:hypothetical protein n=1 Tax=Lichenicoccus sp. TaxID=2781899 RepID=UPI003D112426
MARAGLIVTTALLLHLALAHAGAPVRLVAALAVLQAGCAAALARGARRRGGGVLRGGLLLLPCLVWPACLAVPRLDLVATLLASHTVLYVALTALFGLSLLPGRTPLVTAMAREVEPRLTPRMLTYTRRVTWVWTLYGPAQVAISMLLLALAPLRVWSLFVNLLDLPLLAGMFLGEFAVRRWWLRGESQASLADGWHAARRRWLSGAPRGHAG